VTAAADGGAREPGSAGIARLVVGLLFSLIIAGSLATSLGLALELIPASPGVLALVFAVHLLLAWLFFRAYRRYHVLFALVLQGRGELFDLAITHLIATGRWRMLRDHFRLRRCQGLVLTGQPLQALGALDQLRRHARVGPQDALSAFAAEAEANLQLDQRYWAEQALAGAAALPGAAKQPDLAAIGARLLALQGDHAAAAEALRALLSARSCPLTKLVRSRNLLWYGQALDALGRRDEAERAWDLAVRAAPQGYYAAQAERAAAQAKVRAR
jgi:tetratricopeptide (TPR) repeat protein